MTQNIEQRTLAAVNQYENASGTIDKFAHADEVLATPAGAVKTFPKISKEWDVNSTNLQQKWAGDAAALTQDWKAERDALSIKTLPVLAWVNGETETNINQQRRFTDGHTYLPKSVPAAMGIEPDNNWIAYTADKSDVLSDVFGSKPVDLVAPMTISPINNKYPKLNAFGMLYELFDDIATYNVKSFTQNAQGLCVITLSDDSTIVAIPADVESKFKRADEAYSRNFKTIADLKAGLSTDNQRVDFSKMIGQRVEWRGYHEESDGGSNWGIVKQGAHVEDGGSILSLSPTIYVEANLGLRFNVKKFGIFGNETLNQTDRFLKALNAKVDGTELIITNDGFPYIVGGGVDDSLDVNFNNIKLIGIGMPEIRQFETNQRDNKCVVFNKSTGVELKGIEFVRINRTPYVVGEHNFQQFDHLLVLKGVKRAKVTKCRFIGFNGDAILVSESDSVVPEYIDITKNYFDGVDYQNRNAVSVVAGTHINVSKNTFERVSNETMPGAIDIEPYPANTLIDYVSVDKNTFIDNRGISADITVSFHNRPSNPINSIRITNNSSTSSKGGGIVCFLEDATIKPASLVLTGNTVSQCVGYPLHFKANANGCNISSNILIGEKESRIYNLPVGGAISNTSITDNTFTRTTDGLALRLGTLQKVMFSKNFITPTINSTDAVEIGWVSGTLANHSIMFIDNFITHGNIITNGIWDSKYNQFKGNIGRYKNVSFTAWTCDAANGLTKTFNFDTIPNDFPVGEFLAVFDSADIAGSDKPILLEGASQGQLRCYNPDDSIAKCYQEFIQFSTSAGLNDFWRRKAKADGTGWNPWCKFSGV